jgi:hypothetical protein
MSDVCATCGKEYNRLCSDGGHLTGDALYIIKLKRELAEARGALQELRIRLHAAGRRPEECYEMSVIDTALAADQPDAVKPCADCGEPTDVWHDGTHLCWKCRA